MAICNTVVVVSKQGRDSKRNQLFPQRKVRGEQNEENGEGEVDNSRTLENGSVDSNDVMRNSNGGSLGREDVMDLSYEAESPDEGALVEVGHQIPIINLHYTKVPVLLTAACITELVLQSQRNFINSSVNPICFFSIHPRLLGHMAMLLCPGHRITVQ